MPKTVNFKTWRRAALLSTVLPLWLGLAGPAAVA